MIPQGLAAQPSPSRTTLRELGAQGRARCAIARDYSGLWRASAGSGRILRVMSGPSDTESRLQTGYDGRLSACSSDGAGRRGARCGGADVVGGHLRAGTRARR